MQTEPFKTPGQLLTSLLEARGWANRLLSSVTGLEESGISRIIQDKKPITADIAVVFEQVFGVGAERFLKLQSDYDLMQARYKVQSNPELALRAEVFGSLPVKEMITRGWINTTNQKNVSELEYAIKEFFGVKELTQIESLPFAAKKTDADSDLTIVQLAWLHRTKKIAEHKLSKRYSENALRSSLNDLKKLLIAPEEARKVPRILDDCGVRFVVVEALKSTKIDGVCFWLDEKSPVIAMTMRYDRMDNFWFVLRHEIEHVLQKDGMSRPVVDTELGEKPDQEIAGEEAVANSAASEFCAPQKRIESFIARKAPLFPTRDFLGLSNVLGVHPSIVAGQIRHKTKRYELFNSYTEKIRSHVLPSAIVDGWGDVAPIGN